MESDHNKMSTYDFIMKRRREQTETEDNNNEKHNEKKALLSTSYFFACCSTKIERMKRSRKVHDGSNCKNFRAKKKKKWFKRNITAIRRESKINTSLTEKELETVEGRINNVQTGLESNSSMRRASADSPSIRSDIHGDVYLGSPERRVLESKGVNGNVEPVPHDSISKVPFNKRISNLSLQTPVSDSFVPGPTTPGLNQQKEAVKIQRRASEVIPITSQRNFFNEHSMNERHINSSDRNLLVSRLCDRSKSIQLDGSVLHKRMKRDPKVQHQLVFRQKSIEQMINTQKLFHQLPGISHDGVKSQASNGRGSIFGDPETCDDNETNDATSERV